MPQKETKSKLAAAPDGLEEIENDAWGVQEVDTTREEDGLGDDLDVEAMEDHEDEEGGWDMEELDLPPETAADSGAALGPSSTFAAPNPGVSATQRWLQRCQLASEHIAAGDFDSGFRLLNRQLGITNFLPLKNLVLELQRSTHAVLPGMSTLPPILSALDRSWNSDNPTSHPTAPSMIYSLQKLEADLQKSYSLVTQGKFIDAAKILTNILHTIPLLVVETRREVDDVKELISIVKEYLIGIHCELKKREIKDNPTRVAELAAYFTHCKLENAHTVLALRSAIPAFYKLKNYNTCAIFCRRLLELNPGQKTAENARRVLSQCENNPTDEVQIQYNAKNPFDICCLTFTPIYRGSKYVECPYTGARFQPECKGRICPLGDIALIGADASGLVCSPTQIR